jgi:DNA-binding LacI/PurR family transcriptional regulator
VGTDRPTLDTVAQAAGVSRMTVSNAYNRPDQLSAATRERVLAVAEQLGYRGPDPAARSLRRGSTGTIGLVLTESLTYAFTDPGLVSILRGIADVLSPAGRAMLLVPTHAGGAEDVVRSALVDALVVVSLDPGDPVVGAVRSRGVPLVTVGSPRLKGHPFLGIDNAGAAGLAAQHLVGLGHSRLAVVWASATTAHQQERGASPVRGVFRSRVEGFIAEAVRLGVDRDAITVVESPTNATDAGRDAAASLMTGRRRPTGVFAVSDVLALGVLAAASEADLHVPGDVSVVGFDGIDEGAYSRPPLTTVAQDLRGRGRLAGEATLALLRGEQVRSSRITPELLVRASTAPPSR